MQAVALREVATLAPAVDGEAAALLQRALQIDARPAAARRPLRGERGGVLRQQRGYYTATRCRRHYIVVKGRRFAIAGIRTREPVGVGSN